jgi:1-deoxy-D-xylulose-5-phosphate synthase
VEHAYRARELLADMAHDVGLVNARFAKPLDTELLEKLLADSPLVVTIEDACCMGGLGSAVSEFATRTGRQDARLVSLGIPDEFLRHRTRDELLRDLGLDAEGIARVVAETLVEIQPEHSMTQRNEAE